MADDHLPASLRRRDRDVSVWEDVEWARGATPSQLSEAFTSLCRLAAEAIRQQPFPEQILAHEDPVSPETDALFARLRDQYRRQA